MNEVVTAFDCGGTYIRALIGDLYGNVLDILKSQGVNPFDSGIESFLHTVEDTYSKLIEGKDYRVKRVCIASSGVELFQNNIPLRMNISFRLKIPAEKIKLVHDGWASLIGAFLGGDGILLVAGTGSVVVGKRGNKFVRYGGWGYLLGDEGSAFDIAVKGIRRAIVSSENKEHTILCDKLKSHYGISDLRDLLKIVYPFITKSTIGDFAREVIECAKNGDKLSLEIVDSAIRSLNRLLQLTVSELGEIKVALSGGLFSNKWFVQKFKSKSSYHFVKPILGPLMSAYWISLNTPKDLKLIDKLKNYKRYD